MTDPQRQARRDIEELNLVLDAAIAVSELPGEFGRLLRDVRSDLVTVASTDPDTDRLRRALERHGAVAIPSDFGVSACSDTAAGMLKLCRAVARLAARSARSTGARDYLDVLAELLLVLAYQADRQDHFAALRLCATEDQCLW